MIQKVKEHAVKKEHDLELVKKDINQKQKRDEKRFEKELKEKAAMLKHKNEEADAKRNKIQTNKKKDAWEREMALRADYEELMEADQKLKAEKERKKREHEEDMFLLDIQKAQDAAEAKGEAIIFYLISSNE